MYTPLLVCRCYEGTNTYVKYFGQVLSICRRVYGRRSYFSLEVRWAPSRLDLGYSAVPLLNLIVLMQVLTL